MRNKLQKFTEFAQSLLPHETGYLLAVQQFDDKAKLAILEQVDRNCRRLEGAEPYDETLDKRKFSNLKLWITERLHASDVDTEYEWLLTAEREIETDSISPAQEERLLGHFRATMPTAYHFVKCYELAQLYRHFLLIRMRYAEHSAVEEFLEKYRAAYDRAHSVRERLHAATEDIVRQYSTRATDSIQWEPWLVEVFHDNTLNGWNRYMALVRLTFIYYNYRRFEPLREQYQTLDRLFSQGKYYSKRLLINYYGNRLLLHSRFQEYDEAEYYGYLSIRVKTADYIHYANNLCGVLLRRKKYDEALRVMKTALPESRTTHSFHNKIGFVALYLRCLHHTGQHRAAENYADTYLRAYRKEIFEHRWHAFFSAYLEALLAQNNFKKIIHLSEKYRLLELERSYAVKSGYLPTIPWFYAVAANRTGQLSVEQMQGKMKEAMQGMALQPDKVAQLEELAGEIRRYVTELDLMISDLFL